MRYLFLYLFFIANVFGNSKETCYTVQLLSKSSTEKKINLDDYPANCKSMTIAKNLAIRCGCYDKKEQAKIDLKKLKSRYKNAIIMSTYKYRFNDKKTLLKQIEKQDKKKLKIVEKKQSDAEIVDEEDGELRLILQVFLYKGDIEAAYKVATIGYEKYKKSYYWNQKMAEICKWTNRSARSIKHLRFLYELKYDKKIEDELIEYGTEFYLYEDIEPLVVSRALNHPTEKNIDLMIHTFKEIGNPEKVIKVLEGEYYKDINNTMFLTKALDLSLEFGDMILSKKYIDIIESKKPYTQKDAALIANYYYIKHDIDKAYKSLSYVDILNIKDSDDNIKYYQLKSDLGWYLQDTENSALASKELMKLNHTRLIDYERILSVFHKKDTVLAAKAAKESYLKFKQDYLFYAYANHALLYTKVDELNKLMLKLESEENTITTKVEYWIIKSQVYKSYKQYQLEEEALLHALSLNPESYMMRLKMLFFYIERNNLGKLKGILAEIDNVNLDSSFYFPIASAYFQLNNINRASYYTNKVMELKDSVSNLLEFKFMQAYIYQSQSNEASFMVYMKDIFNTLKKQAKVNPELKKKNQYLSNYLRSGIYILSADKFKQELKKAKKYLTKENYQDISYSFAIRHSAYEKSSKIYHKIAKKELWLLFSNSMVFNNSSVIGNLLITNLSNLSPSEASQAAFGDGQESLAQSLAFDSFVNNDANQNAYMQHLEMSKKRSDILNIKVSHNNQIPLSQKYLQIDNSVYLNHGYYFNTDAKYSLNRSSNEEELLNVPKETKSATIGLKKEFDKAYIETNLEAYSLMKDYLGISLIGSYRLSADLTSTITLSKNREATEGNYLFLGGKKDILSLNLVWSILNSTSIDFLYERNKYSSQDEVYIGSGNYAKVSINYQIRNGYPDLKIGTSYDRGSYFETGGSRGIIDKLMPKINKILPAEFYNIGINFSYGMANSGGYTRVWRPYFELSPSYNSVTQAYSYGYSVGYGGKVFHQDHLSIGIIYTESTNPKENAVTEIYINYKFLYKHPKM